MEDSYENLISSLRPSLKDMVSISPRVFVLSMSCVRWSGGWLIFCGKSSPEIRVEPLSFLVCFHPGDPWVLLPWLIILLYSRNLIEMAVDSPETLCFIRTILLLGCFCSWCIESQNKMTYPYWWRGSEWAFKWSQLLSSLLRRLVRSWRTRLQRLSLHTKFRGRIRWSFYLSTIEPWLKENLRTLDEFSWKKWWISWSVLVLLLFERFRS